jgi:hypothetical protein
LGSCRALLFRVWREQLGECTCRALLAFAVVGVRRGGKAAVLAVEAALSAWKRWRLRRFLAAFMSGGGCVERHRWRRRGGGCALAVFANIFNNEFIFYTLLLLFIFLVLRYLFNKIKQ